MTATQLTNNRNGVIPILLLLTLLVVFITLSLPIGIPNEREVDLPQLSAHALLHIDSRLAWNWVRNNGKYCKYDCDDGRTRYVCGMPENRWAIVVLDAFGIVTSFTADQAYAKDVIDNGCHNPYRIAHP
jgi:hypothetical protein